MKLEAHKFITNMVNPIMNPIIHEVEELGTWEGGVYRFGEKRKVNPLESVLNDFRNDATDYEELDDNILLSLMDKYSEEILNLIQYNPSQADMILNNWNRLLSDIASLYNKKESKLTVKIVDRNNKEIFGASVEVLEKRDSDMIFRGKTNQEKPLEVNLVPRTCHIKIQKRHWLIFKKNADVVISLFKNREIRVRL